MHKLFILRRDEDVSGISGVGDVAEGVEFSDGVVVIRWRGLYGSTVVWKSIKDAIAIHGHDGKTKVVWVS